MIELNEYTDRIPIVRDILSTYMGFQVTPKFIHYDLEEIFIHPDIQLPNHCDDARIIVSSPNKSLIRCLCMKHKDTRLSLSIAKQLYTVLFDKHEKTGYIYCFATPSMPGIVKVGMTTRTPEARLKEANSSNTWKPPQPYHIVIAKQHSNPKLAEVFIHNTLSEHGERVVGNREFFKISEDKVCELFGTIN